MAMYLYGKIYRINTPSPKYVVWVTGVTILPNYKNFVLEIQNEIKDDKQ